MPARLKATTTYCSVTVNKSHWRTIMIDAITVQKAFCAVDIITTYIILLTFWSSCETIGNGFDRSWPGRVNLVQGSIKQHCGQLLMMFLLGFASLLLLRRNS